MVTPDTTALVNSFIYSVIFATTSVATAACTPDFFVAALTVTNAAIFTAATYPAATCLVAFIAFLIAAFVVALVTRIARGRWWAQGSAPDSR
jgi:membrane protein implicated in regulation of membrane protease activity